MSLHAVSFTNQGDVVLGSACGATRLYRREEYRPIPKEEIAMLTLKQIRKERNLSVPQLVELSGVSRRTIQEMETRNDCRMSTAYKLAVALGITLDDLWEPGEAEE